MMAASQFASLRSCDHLSADIPLFLQGGVVGLFTLFFRPPAATHPQKTDSKALQVALNIPILF